MSPHEKLRPIISPLKAEINFKEELKKGSQMLRQEASFNLQNYGGSFMPDFYGGKARMDFSSRNGNQDHVSLMMLI